MKDEQLWKLSRDHNVAQFVSFGPGPSPCLRFSCLTSGDAPDSAGYAQVLQQLLVSSTEGRVNVRSFRADQPKGNPFHYGLADLEEIAALVERLSVQGFYTIVNETIDVNDGGVSGVASGSLIEVAPKDTPRAVEKAGIFSASRELGLSILSTIYGVKVGVPLEMVGRRIEFSLHPRRVGYRREHTLIWEADASIGQDLEPHMIWPNRLSEFIGDKAFGLTAAAVAGLPVPRTTVISRAVAPYTFGQSTGTGEWWIRTCPPIPRPGFFSTFYGWRDPFELLHKEDPDGRSIASVLAQEHVEAGFSGAAHSTQNGDLIEGIKGRGDEFMLGADAPSNLPTLVLDSVSQLLDLALQRLGRRVRIEWVFDGTKTWVVQLHTSGVGTVGTQERFEREPKGGWLKYDPEDGIRHLSTVIARASEDHAGVEVTRLVGQTSHVGELLRAAGIPSRFSRGSN